MKASAKYVVLGMMLLLLLLILAKELRTGMTDPIAGNRADQAAKGIAAPEPDWFYGELVRVKQETYPCQ